MEKQVLSIEQMQELIKLGIDTSKASHVMDDKRNIILVNDEQIINVLHREIIMELIPIFSLQDVLDLLPSLIPEPESDGYVAGHSYLESDLKRTIWYKSWHLDDHHIITFQKSSLLESAFEMLKWLKQNKYL